MADAIRQFDLLQPGDRVLCALSGGTDSVCLTHLLATRAAELDITVAAAHFSHGLRPESAAGERELCQRLCDRLGLPLFCGAGDTSAYAKAQGLGMEEAARLLRRAFLEQTAESWGATRIATGHHLEDSAETLLLNLIRGSGGRGMQGIPPKSENRIRPLILMTKGEILEYIREHRLEYAEDPTNFSGDNARALLRREVFPVLEGLNGQAAQHLARTALDAWQRDEHIRTGADELTSCFHVEADEASIPVSTLLAAGEETAVRALQTVQHRLGGKMLERPHLKAVFDLCRGSDPSAQAHLPGTKAFRRYHTLVLTGKQDFPAPEPTKLHLNVPIIFGGWQVHLTDASDITEGLPLILDPQDLPLTVRSRREGDGISLPFGTKNLKKLLIERKIPKDLRDNIPIICNNKEILAVGDFCVAHMPQREGGHYRLICRRKKI